MTACHPRMRIIGSSRKGTPAELGSKCKQSLLPLPQRHERGPQLGTSQETLIGASALLASPRRRLGLRHDKHRAGRLCRSGKGDGARFRKHASLHPGSSAVLFPGSPISAHRGPALRRQGHALLRGAVPDESHPARARRARRHHGRARLSGRDVDGALRAKRRSWRSSAGSKRTIPWTPGAASSRDSASAPSERGRWRSETRSSSRPRSRSPECPRGGSSSVRPAPLFLVIHSLSDEIFPLEPLKKFIGFCEEQGLRIEFRPVPGLSHYRYDAFVPALGEAVPWVKSVWQKD